MVTKLHFQEFYRLILFIIEALIAWHGMLWVLLIYKLIMKESYLKLDHYNPICK